MDPIMILALVLFFGMIVVWFVLPSTTSPGVIEQESETVGLGAAQQA